MAARRALLGELLMTLSTVASVLKEKEKSKLVSVVPSTSVADAVRAMNNENIGAVLVLDGQKLVGIFTERDVMVRVVGAKRDPATTPVSEVMTTAVRSVELTSRANDALRLMSDRHHRHLPVLENGQVRGLVSIGDLTRWVIRSQQQQFDMALLAVKQMGMSNRRG
jgi:CBS domain-containing protein